MGMESWKAALNGDAPSRTWCLMGMAPAEMLFIGHPKRSDRQFREGVFDAFDFTLTSDEVASIDALDTGVRGGPDPEGIDTNRFRFRIED